MCGIICVLSRKASRPAPGRDEVLAALDEGRRLLELRDPTRVAEAARTLSIADGLLKGEPGVRALVGNRELVSGVNAAVAAMLPVLAVVEADLEAADDAHAIEASAEAIAAVKDVLWSLRNDRLRTAREVEALAGLQATPGALDGYLAIQQALSAIDRMEVRGRDSAGIGVVVWGHGLTAERLPTGITWADRCDDPLFVSRSLRVTDDVWTFVYKAAAEIGELGDNTRAIRRQVLDDDVLRHVLAQPGARVTLIGHTRWASVGIISEPNAHPVTGEETNRPSPLVLAVLNGDVDNYADLKVEHGLSVAEPITTDAKVIPSLVARQLSDGVDLKDAFVATVTQFEGSVAIASVSVTEPDRVMLALKGSGQGMCIGLAEEAFIVASEPYGTVEETAALVRMDGERGEIIELRSATAGRLAGMTRFLYDGSPAPVTDDEVTSAGVTTRDIDRGEAPHFLLKEILEAPESFRKTIRGRIHEHDGLFVADLDEEVFPEFLRREIAEGKIRRIRIIGQGTAAVAGSSMVSLLVALTGDAIDVDALTATEFSGFGLSPDMSDTLVVAVSQSGTTTDTNRTVDLARGRGARVVAIVNRRNSDLVLRSDGVLYTSDGRDIEMSVASTKAFYAQVAAGALLSCAISDAANLGSAQLRSRVLGSMRRVPDAMRAVIGQRPAIADAARRHAPGKRYWAVVGNGGNAVAAHEVRIKLSELCYKSISCDITEDKKHIDLSCEPLILVCAAGLEGGTASDVAKEIAIYRAHKATPIVVATEGEQRFDAASAVLTVPEVDQSVAFILSAMVGHLFGYEAALAIDATARPLREVRETIRDVVATHADAATLVSTVSQAVAPATARFRDALLTGQYDGTLEASTAVRLSSVLADLSSRNPLDSYQRQTGKVVTPAVLLDDLTEALTRAIDELTRPIDAIRHQAKTVTVGISRSDEGLMDRALVQAVVTAGASRDRLTYRTLKILADLDLAVSTVNGFTRYRVEGGTSDDATITIIDRGGLSKDLKSRVDGTATLVGTKHRVARDQEVFVTRGRADGRTVILVPEVKSGETTGITLLHVTFRPMLDAATMKTVLKGYDDRYNRLVDWVKETESEFRDDLLARLGVADALIAPISEAAELWRTR
ncbi:MAG: putative glucosamine-6-phosphate synthase [Actinomycetota bacterium]|jgi:glucosamine--fructose-6-phosphate aminotransferase (isomerizing)